MGPVAQWSEQGTHNPLVVGSIPTRPTMKKIKSFLKSTYRVVDNFFFPSQGAEVWGFAAAGIFIYFWVSFIIDILNSFLSYDFNPLNPVGYPSILNSNYDSSLGEIEIEQCWTEGHPAFGDVVCDSVDMNPMYISDPVATNNRITFFIFIFFFIFIIARIFHHQKYNLNFVIKIQDDKNKYKLKELMKNVRQFIDSNVMVIKSDYAYQLKEIVLPKDKMSNLSDREILTFLKNNIEIFKKEYSNPTNHLPYSSEYTHAFYNLLADLLLEMSRRTNHDDFYTLFLNQENKIPFWKPGMIHESSLKCYSYSDFSDRIKLIDNQN